MKARKMGARTTTDSFAPLRFRMIRKIMRKIPTMIFW